MATALRSPDTGMTIGSRQRLAAAPKGGVVAACFALLILLNVAIPKGGFSTGGAPLTWGYILFGAILFPALLGVMYRQRLQPIATIHFAVTFLPLSLLIFYKVLGGESVDVHNLIPIVNFVLLPFSMLVLIAPYLEELTEAQIGWSLKWAVRFAVAWGLMNFTLYAVAKHFVEVPYVTVNAGDVGTIFGKNNRRGSLMKLVSTYNNGNIFGVCMVMLLPVYIHFERSRLWIAATILAIVASLSRTVWFGGGCVFGLMVLTGQIKFAKTSTFVAIFVGIMALAIALPAMGWDASKLADTDLGGRAVQFEHVELTLFGAPVIMIHELIYVSFLQSFGLIGLVPVMAALLFPVVYGIGAMKRLTPLRKAALAGYTAYLFCGLLDGAFIFPPVILQFLFLSILLYRRGYIPAAGRQAL